MKIYWNGERKNVIGSRVKELRKKQNISQKDFGSTSFSFWD